MADHFGAGYIILAGLAFALVSQGSARAQMSSNPVEINACLCQQQGIATLSADMSPNPGIGGRPAACCRPQFQLLQSRQHLDVNNAEAEAQYKALLAQRDQAYKDSIGPVVGAADQATTRYNALVNQYNAQCANRIFNADMMAQAQTHLVCPPLQ